LNILFLSLIHTIICFTTTMVLKSFSQEKVNICTDISSKLGLNDARRVTLTVPMRYTVTRRPY